MWGFFIINIHVKNYIYLCTQTRNRNMPGFESFNTVRPGDEQEAVSTEAANTEQATTEENTAVETEETTTEQVTTEEVVDTKPPKEVPDTFIENFNKRYSTEYKSDDEIKSLFSLTGKVGEYEEKLKGHEELQASAEKYKKELEELKVNGTSDLLSKPRIRSAYVAEQLVAKYPDRDPDILASVAMSDIDKMSDIEAIAKERMITVKGLTYDEAKLAKLADFNIDSDTAPEEWDSVANARIKIAGAEAKERIKQLLAGIELPKTVTKEEREEQQANFVKEKTKAIEPIKEVFKKFDTYKNGEFEFVVPDEFKSKLENVFNGMFIDGGLEVNEENIATAELLKKALFVEEYFPKMLEVKEKQVLAKLKEEQDALLHNDTPPNTATATDQGTTEDPNRPGLSKFFQSR